MIVIQISSFDSDYDMITEWLTNVVGGAVTSLTATHVTNKCWKSTPAPVCIVWPNSTKQAISSGVLEISGISSFEGVTRDQ